MLGNKFKISQVSLNKHTKKYSELSREPQCTNLDNFGKKFCFLSQIVTLFNMRKMHTFLNQEGDTFSLTLQ